MTQNEDLVVRRHMRDDVNLRGEFEVAEEHREQITLSRGAHAGPLGLIPVRIFDISSGGLGWQSGVFLPRRCQGEIRVLVGPEDEHEVVFTHRVDIRRVRMTDETPTYSVGAAFADPDEMTTASVNEFIACFIRPASDSAHGDVA